MAKSTLSRIAFMAATVWLALGSSRAIGHQVQATSTGWEYAETHTYDETVKRAMALLPKRPQRIVVIDAEKTPRALRQRLERVDAFVVVGRPIVCLRMQGLGLQRAHRSRGIFDYALAAIIWHEMAHIEGADERGAQQEEESLWRSFIVGQHVDIGRALAYLARLRERRNHDGFLRGTEDSMGSAK